MPAPPNDHASPSGRGRARRGVWLFPGPPTGALVDAVIAADELGLDEVWIADEGVAREPFVVLAAAARQTSRIRLAVGITSPLLRHPGAIAATAATLDELSGGRAVLGLGVGGQLSLDPFGLRTDRPVGAMRDAIATARAVLSCRDGGGYTVPAHAFGPREVPIWVGARGPQLTAMAARLADGVFLSGCSPDEHVDIIERVRATGSAGVALFQSADDDPLRRATVRWNDIGRRLESERRRHEPDAIGINLVATDSPDADPVALVARAAEILGPL